MYDQQTTQTVSGLRAGLRQPRLVLALVACLWLPAADAAFGQLTRDEALQAVIDEVIVPSPNEPDLAAYAPQTLLAAGTTVAPFDTETEPFPGSVTTLASDTWFVWIDDLTDAHFVHPTRFVYVDASHPAPTLGDGITVEVQGWWPVIDGADFYRDAVERLSSADLFYGSPPDGPAFDSGPGRIRRGLAAFGSTRYAGADLSGGTKCGILVSGSPGREFQGDLDDLESALQDVAGVPAGNIQKKLNATKAELETLIDNANNAGCTKVFLHIGSHGGVNRIVFADGLKTAAELATCLKEIDAAAICITLESCHSGSLVDEISTCLAGKDGVSISATDAAKSSRAWVRSDGSDGNSFFVEDFIACWRDPDADGDDDGTDVSQAEAYAWVLVHGRQKTKDQNPQIKSHGLIHEDGFEAGDVSAWSAIGGGCVGQSCGFYTFDCSSSNPSCACVRTFEGPNACIAPVACEGLQPCPRGAIDCLTDEVCAIETCCGEPVCVPNSCPGGPSLGPLPGAERSLFWTTP